MGVYDGLRKEKGREEEVNRRDFFKLVGGGVCAVAVAGVASHDFLETPKGIWTVHNGRLVTVDGNKLTFSEPLGPYELRRLEHIRLKELLSGLAS